MIGSERMNSIAAAVACHRTKANYGVLTAEENQFWDDTVAGYADATAGGYMLEIPSEWPDMTNCRINKNPKAWGTDV